MTPQWYHVISETPAGVSLAIRKLQAQHFPARATILGGKGLDVWALDINNPDLKRILDECQLTVSKESVSLPDPPSARNVLRPGKGVNPGSGAEKGSAGLVESDAAVSLRQDRLGSNAASAPGHHSRKRIEMPPLEEFLERARDSNSKELAERYKVSVNTIRRWMEKTLEAKDIEYVYRCRELGCEDVKFTGPTASKQYVGHVRSIHPKEKTATKQGRVQRLNAEKRLDQAAAKVRMVIAKLDKVISREEDRRDKRIAELREQRDALVKIGRILGVSEEEEA